MGAFNFSVVLYRYEVIGAAIILLLTGGISVSSQDADAFLRPLPRYPYAIALTFDDGPHPYFTDAILSQLKDHGATATFFVVGRQVAKYPGLARSIVANGCELQGHTMSHRNLTRLTEAAVRQELRSSQQLIRSVTGKNPVFFRPPGGQYTGHVAQIGEDMGLKMVLWSVFPRDHEEDDPDAIVARVLEQARDGGIILLHSGRRPTLAALPRVIAGLRARGYRFVTVNDIMKQRRAV